MKRNDFNEGYRDLLLKYDPSYFISKHLSESHYTPNDINLYYSSYESQLAECRNNIKRNKKQYILLVENQVKKMFNDGMLQSLYGFDGSVNHIILNFKEYGRNMAIYYTWRKHERPKLIYKKLWAYLTKVGVILAFILSLIKLLELLKIAHFE